MKAIIQAQFKEYDEARSALELLIAGGVTARQFTVIGVDNDAFREATTVLHKKGADKLVIGSALVGLVIGSFWGFICAPKFASSHSPELSMVMAIICGAVLGMYTGAHMGGILNLDNAPRSDANFFEGTVEDAVIGISIAVSSDAESDKVSGILLSAGADRVPVLHDGHMLATACAS
jgi:hypothetical protein